MFLLLLLALHLYLIQQGGETQVVDPRVMHVMLAEEYEVSVDTV